MFSSRWIMDLPNYNSFLHFIPFFFFLSFKEFPTRSHNWISFSLPTFLLTIFFYFYSFFLSNAQSNPISLIAFEFFSPSYFPVEVLSSLPSWNLLLLPLLLFLPFGTIWLVVVEPRKIFLQPESLQRRCTLLWRNWRFLHLQILRKKNVLPTKTKGIKLLMS